MSSIADAIAGIRDAMQKAAARSGREVKQIKLLAVSKTFPADAIKEAAETGQQSFGESRLQEAEPKLRELGVEYDWHFIGNVQRNKVRKLLPLFPTIHSLSNYKLAMHMDRIAGELRCKPKVFLEVNIGCEESKHGFLSKELREHFGALLNLKNLDIQGLMCIPPAGSAAASRSYFRELRLLQDELMLTYEMKLPELSMGMSGDFEIAIEEGSTVVRVGSAIFGGR